MHPSRAPGTSSNNYQLLTIKNPVQGTVQRLTQLCHVHVITTCPQNHRPPSFCYSPSNLFICHTFKNVQSASIKSSIWCIYICTPVCNMNCKSKNTCDFKQSVLIALCVTLDYKDWLDTTFMALHRCNTIPLRKQPR